MSIYYSPETFGLTVVGEAEASGGYEFDKFVIWRDRHGDYFWAKDSGCSCPVPFEDYDLSNLPIGSARDAVTDLNAWIASGEWEERVRDRKVAAESLLSVLTGVAA